MEEEKQVNKVQLEPAVFPEFHLFPDDILTDWVALPANEPLAVGPITKSALDQLLFSSQDLARAIHALRAAMIFTSNNDLEQAQTCLKNCETATNDATNRNRLLFDAIIRSTLELRNGSK